MNKKFGAVDHAKLTGQLVRSCTKCGGRRLCSALALGAEREQSREKHPLERRFRAATFILKALPLNDEPTEEIGPKKVSSGHFHLCLASLEIRNDERPIEISQNRPMCAPSAVKEEQTAVTLACL